MSSLLQHLENNEAVLLMYLAGELPPEDRAEVEQLLAGDAGMRAELESLRQTHDAMTLALSEADGISIAPLVEAGRRSAAVRRVSRAMVERHLEQTAAKATAKDESANGANGRRWRIPPWAYPVAAAAMILIVWVAYWGVSPPKKEPLQVRYEESALIASLDPDPTDRQALVMAENQSDDPGLGDLNALLRAVGQESVNSGLK